MFKSYLFFIHPVSVIFPHNKDKYTETCRDVACNVSTAAVNNADETVRNVYLPSKRRDVACNVSTGMYDIDNGQDFPDNRRDVACNVSTDMYDREHRRFFHPKRRDVACNVSTDMYDREHRRFFHPNVETLHATSLQMQ